MTRRAVGGGMSNRHAGTASPLGTKERSGPCLVLWCEIARLRYALSLRSLLVAFLVLRTYDCSANSCRLRDTCSWGTSTLDASLQSAGASSVAVTACRAR
jgi:hypothetical protein